MALTEKQKNCPYCHENILGQIKQIVHLNMDVADWMDPDIHEVLLDPRHSEIVLQGNVGGCGEYVATKNINYCPMCGRPLGEEKWNNY